MILLFNNFQKNIVVNDESYIYQAIMGEYEITLNFSLNEYINFPIGTRTIFLGEEFVMRKPFNITKIHNENYEYSMILEGEQSNLKKYKLRNVVDKKLKFSMTARPRTHLELIVANLNLRENDWRIGSCIESTAKLISYNHTYLIDALNTLASEFNTEWEIINKTIYLHKVEHGKDNPLPLSYGKGEGFLSGVSRTNQDDKKAIEILYVQGGDRNINFSEYGNTELLLPKNYSITVDNHTYITDDKGLSVRRSDVPLLTKEEDSLDLSNIYPQHEGTVSSMEIEDAENHWYNFIDNSIPDDLDFNECLSTEAMTVIFQSGMLTGKEFEVYEYIHATRKFKLKPQEFDGMMMPNENFKPGPGTKYGVFHSLMPDYYVQEASLKMLDEAIKYLDEHHDPRFSFVGNLDPIYAKKHWENIGNRLNLGNFISFTDDQFQQTPILIRITSIKRFLNNPYSPTIELSNCTNQISVSSELNKMEGQEVVVADNLEAANLFTKRTFKHSEELINIISNDFKNFDPSISPATIKTMMMLVGDKSLQFRFVNEKVNPSEVNLQVGFNDSNKKLTVASGILQHQGLGVADGEKYRYWDIPEFISGELYKPKQIYRLYAKVEKNGNNGEFILNENEIGQNEIDNFYHLLLGYVSSEDSGTRSFARMYGFTEVLPGQITTGKIASPYGSGCIEITDDKIKVLANDFQIISNGSHYKFPIDKGNWYAGTYNYYDRVSHNGSLWLCISNSGTTDEPSETSTAWQKQVSQGETGEAGEAGEMLTGAKMLYKDPEFKRGYNGTTRYNNGGKTSLWYRIPKQSDVPTESTHIMLYRYAAPPVSPDFGGFTFRTQTRANAVFITKIIAKIPIGRQINFGTNEVGIEHDFKWLTSQNGTGKYETYILKLVCGTTGTFSTTNYFYFSRGEDSPFSVYVAFATVYDLTLYDDYYDNKIAEYKTKFTQTDEKISLLATKTEVNELGETVSYVSQIAQTAQSISLTVQEEIDNFEIGGRNLIQGSDFKINIPNFSYPTPHTSGNITYVTQCSYSFSPYLEKGNYVISFLAKAIGIRFGEVWGKYKNSNTFSKLQATSKLSSSWNRYTLSFVLENEITEISLTGNSSGVNFALLKLEKGNIATAWTPAPEDVGIQMLATGIDIQHKKITLTADNTFIRSNTGQSIAAFVVEDGKPMFKASNIKFDGLMSTKNGNFQVNQDGTIKAINGEFSGKITAESGKISSFVIEDSQLKEGSFANGGLQLGNSHVIFRNDNQGIYAGFGSNVFAGSSGVRGFMNVEKTGGGRNYVGVNIKVRPTGFIAQKKSKALIVDGNTKISGQHLLIYDGYIGTAYNDTIQRNIFRTNHFVFNDVANNFNPVYLPEEYDILNEFGRDVTFLLYITMTIEVGSKKIQVKGNSPGQVINWDGNTFNGGNGHINLHRGDSVVLRYYNGKYYVVSIVW